MNNNEQTIIRAIATYVLIIPLAIMIGYVLTIPLSYSSLAVFTAVVLGLVFPLLLRWHYFLLLFCWNMSAVAFFVKGSPGLSLLMIVISLAISISDRMMNQKKTFMKAPQATWSLLALIIVVLFTAKMTGGLGLRAFGSEVYGGKKYIFALVSILGFFALSAQRIAPEKRILALQLFFLGGLTYIIGDLVAITPSWLEFIYWIFPPAARLEATGQVSRLGGTCQAASAMAFYLLARHGIRGLFLSGKTWRMLFFCATSVLVLAGGYRSGIIFLGMTFIIQFFLEGLHRTKLLPIFLGGTVMFFALAVPLTPKLPYTVQRSLSFLPLPVSAEAQNDAEDSLQWRLDLWKSLWPQVPRYLFLGKGYAITMEDYQMMGGDSAFAAFDPSSQGLALAGDVHNGWLSVILTFGIWGMIALVWFLCAGIYILYRNYKYGDESLRLTNAFLLSAFIAHALMTLTVFGGGLHTDMLPFTGYLGLCLALNGGVCRPVTDTDPVESTAHPSKAFPRWRHRPTAARPFARRASPDSWQNLGTNS